MKLTMDEELAYKCINNMIINNSFKPGLHSKRWFATKFNLNHSQAYKIINIFVNRGLIIPTKSKGYKVNQKLLSHILLFPRSKDIYKYELLKFKVEDKKCYVEKKVFLNNIFYAYLKSSFIINSPIKKKDLEKGILNFLSLEHLIWESSKEIKINFESKFFEGISVVMNSKIYNLNYEVIEKSSTEFNPKFFEEKYTKIY